MPLFDLTTEKWIGALRLDGREEFLGMREILTTAHDLRVIRDPLPTIEFGLYRLLTALLLDIYFIDGDVKPNLRRLSDIMETGKFDAGRIDAYFTKYANRFDLFDLQYPFLQTAGMEGETPKPLAGLLHPQPSGTNAAHFHHTHEDDFGVSPAIAARLLTTIAPFMTAGGAGLSPSVNGAPPWYALVRGANLFETVCLNTCLLPDYTTKMGVPAWRDPRTEIGGERRPSAGYAEALTWRPRRIQLISGPTGICSVSGQLSETLVRTMRFSAGDSCDFPYQDPNVAYRYGSKGRVAYRPQEGKQVWRDTGALLLLDQREGDNKRSDRPRIIDQYKALVSSSSSQSLDIVLYGMRTDMKMKIFEWQREPLSLPARLLWNTRMHHDAEEAMEKADAVAGAIRYAIKRAYPREGAGNKGAFDARIAQALRQFWDSLRADYHLLLESLAPLDPEGDEEKQRTAHRKWQAQVVKTAWGVVGEAIDDLDSNADALERWAKARAGFAKSLVRILPRDKKETIE